MNNFNIKTLVTDNIEAELEKVGFDIAYRAKASDKFRYKTFKIFDLTLPQANILKQTALSFGADCGLHRDVLTSKIEKTDVILGGSYSQLKKICEKLEHQPFSLKFLSSYIVEIVLFDHFKITFHMFYADHRTGNRIGIMAVDAAEFNGMSI